MRQSFWELLQTLLSRQYGGKTRTSSYRTGIRIGVFQVDDEKPTFTLTQVSQPAGHS